MTNHRTRLTLVALPVGAGLVLAAPLAHAAINSPGSTGVQYTQDTSISIDASWPAGSQQNALSLTDPRGKARNLYGPVQGNAFSSSSYSGSFDTQCAPGGNCSSAVPALNGQWTLKQSGSASDTKTFVLRIPPRTPNPVRAQLTASREITVTWPVGAEPDLTGWTVVDGNGRGVLREVARSECSSSCSAIFGYNADDTGDRSFAVRSHRLVDPSRSDVIDSADSPSATATLPPPPPPSPTPSPTPSATPPPSDPPAPAGGTGGSPGAAGGGSSAPSAGPTASPGASKDTGGTTVSRSTGGSTGGTGSGKGSTGGSGGSSGGGSTAIATSTKVAAIQDQRKAFALSFSSFAPKLGIAKLPPLPLALAPTLAGGEAPLPDGTYQQTLGYTDQVKREKITTVSQAATAVSGAVASVLDSRQLMRSIAGALVLMLLGAHLRRWLAQSR